MRQELAKILGSKQFSQDKNKENILDMIAQFIKQIIEWVKEKIQSLGLPKINLLPDNFKISSGASLILKIIGILILALFVIIIVFFVRKNIRSSKKVKEDMDAELLSILKDSNEVEQRAFAFSQEGNYRQALRFLYLSTLIKFNEVEIIRIDKAKTNRQYVNEVRLVAQNLNEIFTDFTSAFNEYWYGNKKLGLKQYEVLQETYISIKKVISI